MKSSLVHDFPVPSLETLRSRPGAKWNHYPPDVLPLWVAEMDYPLAAPLKRAIVEQVERDDLGYLLKEGLPGLNAAVAERLTRKHGYLSAEDDVLQLGTTGSGLNLAVRAFTEPGDAVLLLTPLYPPFKNAVESSGRVATEVELVNTEAGYVIDFDALEAAVTERTRLMMLCNPHNPVGRVFTEEELRGLADLAARSDMVIVSDDLHADILFDGRHVPIASLSEGVAARTVTLYGPTKAFNIPGLKISFAISQNHELLKRMEEAGGSLATPPNILAQAATLGAYREGGDWLNATLAYLKENRDYLLGRVARTMPRVRVHSPQATYLAWLDLRDFELGENLAEALAERAKVGLNDGSDYGAGGAGFVRLNFATSREILSEALSRLERLLGSERAAGS